MSRRRCIYKKIHHLTLTLGLRSHEMLPSTLYIMWPIQLQSLKLLRLTVKEEIHLQENTLFDLDPKVKVTRNVIQYPLHHMSYSATKFEVTTSNGLEEGTVTRNVTDGRTPDRLWYEINILFFLRKNGYITMWFITTMRVTISEAVFKASIDRQTRVAGHDFSFRTTKYPAVTLRAEWLLKWQ